MVSHEAIEFEVRQLALDQHRALLLLHLSLIECTHSEHVVLPAIDQWLVKEGHASLLGQTRCASLLLLLLRACGGIVGSHPQLLLWLRTLDGRHVLSVLGHRCKLSQSEGRWLGLFCRGCSLRVERHRLLLLHVDTVSKVLSLMCRHRLQRQ